MRRNTLILWALWLASAWLGCQVTTEPAEEQDNTTPFASLEPYAKRLSPATLPWKAAAGAIVDRDIEYTAKTIPFLVKETVKGGLMAVAEARGLLFVVFPPEDRVGFDLAWAGVDLPWERIHLTDTPVESVGAVDAVGDAVGNVHIVIRESIGDLAITHYTYGADGQVNSESVPRPSELVWSTAHTHCDDLQIGVTPDGGIDVVFQHFGEQAVATQVIVAHRSKDQATWQYETALDSRNAEGPAVPSWGCRNRMAYDEDWKPMLMVLYSSVEDGNWTHTTLQVLQGADGHYYRGPSDLTVDGFGPWFIPQFDIARSPLGYIVFGQNTMQDESYLMPVFMHSLSILQAIHPRQLYQATRPGSGAEPSRNGGKIVFTACGTAELWAPMVPGGWPLNTVWYNESSCPVNGGYAPVFFQSAPAAETAVYVFNHGQDEFQAALCLNAQGELAICRGGYSLPWYDPQINPVASKVAPLEMGLRMASSSIESGALDIPSDTASVVVTLANWPIPEGTEVSVRLTDDSGASWSLPATADPAARTLTIPFPPESLQAGLSYTLVLPDYVVGDGKVWPALYALEQPTPTLRFTVAGDPYDGLWEPRSQPIRLTGCHGRDPDGVCFIELKAEVPLDTVIALSREFRLDGAWSLKDPAGQDVPETVVLGDVWDGLPVLIVRSETILAGGAEYDLSLDEVVDVEYGTRLPAEDLHIRIRTGLPLPQLLSTQPSDQAVDVPVDASLRLEFNVPMNFASVVQFVSCKEMATMKSVPLSAAQESPTTFILSHPDFVPGAQYQVDIPASVVDEELRPLGQAALVVFTTAP